MKIALLKTEKFIEELRIKIVNLQNNKLIKIESERSLTLKYNIVE